MKFYILLFFSLLIFTFSGCENDPEILTVSDDGTQITINLQNLPAIGDTVSYVVWLEGLNAPVKIGVLDNITSQSVSKTFTPLLANLKNSNTVLITIQSANDTVPGSARILAGTIQANSGTLNIANASATGAALDSAAGNYTLFTPTDTLNTQQRSGIWFVNYNGGNIQQGLFNLPELSEGWKYAGRIEISGIVLTTGKFTEPDASDEQAPYSGTHMQIGFPGEDFLNNPPAGVTFPLDLAGARVSIVVVPNNNVSSQGFTVMSADIPADAAPFTTYGMNLNSVFPMGNFTIDVNL
jgi:hypothetical protein